MPNLDSDLSISELMDLANDAEVTQNDFDALINFDDTGAELFAADDGLNINGNPKGQGYGFNIGAMDNVPDLFGTENKGVGLAGLGDGQLHEDRTSTTLGANEVSRAELNGIADLEAELGLNL